MSLFNVLGTARDGMAAQTAALSTAGANVANATTPGYARRTVLLETTIGGSVRYASTGRSFDRFAYARVVEEQGKLSSAQARASALNDVETIMAPPSSSIGDRAIELVKSFNSLAGFPTDPSIRADVLDKANSFATTISSAATALASTSEMLVGRAGDIVTTLNNNLARIADLNDQIATAVGTGADSAALRDQRDAVVRSVGEHIGARAIEDNTGRVTLYAAGTVLVEGNNSSKISLELDATTGAMKFFATGATKSDITARVDTGTLGGLREARDVDLAKTQANLDTYAFDVMNTFNAIHVTGYGQDGVTGRNLFTVPGAALGAARNMTVDASVIGHPERVGAAGAAGDLPGGNAVALRLADLGDNAAFGGQTLADRFASLATDIGFRKVGADSEVTLRTDTMAAAESLSESANGVSIDEEMVNLSQYQRAFEASSKVLQAINDLLKSFMDSF